jgi:hypothetical protein
MGNQLDQDLSFLNDNDENNLSVSHKNVKLSKSLINADTDSRALLSSDIDEENNSLNTMLKTYKMKENVMSLIFDYWIINEEPGSVVFQKKTLQKENVLKAIINGWKV